MSQDPPLTLQGQPCWPDPLSDAFLSAPLSTIDKGQQISANELEQVIQDYLHKKTQEWWVSKKMIGLIWIRLLPTTPTSFVCLLCMWWKTYLLWMAPRQQKKLCSIIDWYEQNRIFFPLLNSLSFLHWLFRWAVRHPLFSCWDLSWPSTSCIPIVLCEIGNIEFLAWLWKFLFKAGI